MARHGRRGDYRNAYAHLGVGDAAQPGSAGAGKAAGAGAGTAGRASAGASTDKTTVVRRPVPAAGAKAGTGASSASAVARIAAGAKAGTTPGAQATASPTPRTTSGASSARRRGFAPIMLLVGALVVLYVGGVVAFSMLFYPNTTLDGSDVSLKMEGEVAQAHTESTESAKLEVSLGEDFFGEIFGSQIDLARDGAAYAHSAMGTQMSWLWPIQAFQTHELSFPEKASFDAEKLHAVVEDMVAGYNEHAIAPTDATATYDTTTGTYRLVPATQGTTIDAAAVEAQVSEALVEQRQAVELTEDCYMKPAVLDDDPALSAAIAGANKVLSATQELTVDGVQVAKVSAQQIGTWVTLAADLSVSVDTEAIQRWTTGELSEQLDTAGARRSYSLPDGSVVSVTGGSYGWIIDGSALADDITEAIEHGEAGSIEVPMRQTAAKHAGAGEADWGSRWVDVNLTTQHAQLIDGGQIIWESDIVSGAVEGGYQTPTGVNAINSNMTCSATTGEQVKLISPFTDEKGEPTYISYVDWWMPFIENQYAFHDAPWRSEFGGSIYEYNGSHGCINLPPEKAEELYRLLSVGDVVVVHN